MTPSPQGVAARLDRPLDAAFDEVQADWRPVTDDFRYSAVGRRLIQFVDARVAAGAVVYPAEPLRALVLTPRLNVRAVILGQDPYHGPGQAEGLAFSVPVGCAWPPSLRNIVKELRRDLGGVLPSSGSLLPWARQGVLLLNTVLTVENGQPASHAKHGWEALTDAIIQAVWDAESPTAFLLWGGAAQAKAAERLSGSPVKHGVWQCNHPSPLSATRGRLPFSGCGHFGASARFLAEVGRPVEWRLDDFTGSFNHGHGSAA